MMYNENKVKMVREMYPEGTRVELVSMDDPYSNLKPGDQGSVMFVDDICTVHVAWDSGSTLGLVYGEDRFKKVQQQENVHEQEDLGPDLSM